MMTATRWITITATLVTLLRSAPADNVARYNSARGTLAQTAPQNNAIASGFAGVVIGNDAATPNTRFDTPDNLSFYPLAQAKLIWGPRSTGLRGPAAANCGWMGAVYGVVSDIRFYMMGERPNVGAAYNGCATNSHLMYNQLIQRIVNCGNRCFVDVGSLWELGGAINHVQPAIREAIRAWNNNRARRPDHRLVLRITVGFPAVSLIGAQVEFFNDVVREGRGRVEVYGISFGDGTAVSGTWSHAKIFGVHNLQSPRTHLTLVGGQNHWDDYDTYRPPFDSNTMLEAAPATLPSLQIDAGLRRFQEFLDNRFGAWVRARWIGKSSMYRNGRVRVETFRLAQRANVTFEGFSGITNTNPLAVPALAAGQHAIMSLIDLGSYSVGARGRTISRALTQMIRDEPADNHIRLWQQSLMFPLLQDHANDRRARNELTPMGSLVRRALLAALADLPNQNDPTIWILTSDNVIENEGYRSVRPQSNEGVWFHLYRTAFHIACVNDRQFQVAYANLRRFNNPMNRRTTCWQAVIAAVNAKIRWRMTRAFLNRDNPGVPAPATRGRVGIHHKLVMFAREAMYQGSYNIYASTLPGPILTAGPEFDSTLVENGILLFKPASVESYVQAFDEAWDNNSREVLGQL